MTETEIVREHMARPLRRLPADQLVEHLAHPRRPLGDDVRAAIKTVLAEKHVSVPREAA